jgi:hypothetical protein
MASVEQIFKVAIEEGMKQDPRPQAELKKKLAQLKDEYGKLKGLDKELFDKEKVTNPYDDTRILHTGKKGNVKNIMVGIDVETADLLLVDQQKRKGKKVDLVMSHHPEGKALAALYGVMDLQIHTLMEDGVPASQAEAVVRPRLDDVRKGLHAFNHSRVPDAAELLDLPFMCLHTVADNHVHQFMKKLLEKKNPDTLKDVLDLLKTVPEYRWAYQHNMGPTLFHGMPNNKLGKWTLDMTGGTELDKKRVEKLVHAGISTIVAMHLSKDQLEECKLYNINVVVAGHMPSDSLGMNLLLDNIEKRVGKLNVVSFAGFHRVRRSKKGSNEKI